MIEKLLLSRAQRELIVLKVSITNEERLKMNAQSLKLKLEKKQQNKQNRMKETVRIRGASDGIVNKFIQANGKEK